MEKKRKSSNKSSSSKAKKKSLLDYTFELTRFIEEQCNIKSAKDFWRFYEKLQILTSNKPPTQRQNLLNIQLRKPSDHLYEKLPLFDRNGERLHISSSDFNEFLLSIETYHDFEQKRKFSKLKKLREQQQNLPIAKHKAEILEKLSRARVVLIAGDTGCGKSTQVPQYIFQGGEYTKIVCTQPRRLACIALSKRVAFEMLAEFKSQVGYQIRFERTKRADTNIIFMTEGLLLRQASDADTLNGYDVFILDEVHERHLHGDFLVGLMKCLLQKTAKFKLILMSATINIELFTNYFQSDGLEVVQVPGRLYPIEIRYHPIVRDPFERKSSKFNCSPYLQIVQMIDDKYLPHQKGDLLVFLNGYSEISTLSEYIKEYSAANGNKWIVLELHSSLSLEQQDRVFDYAPDGTRKCIISTNIAETSVTIDGIRFVCDSGRVNRMVYQQKMHKLSETAISQDSARQRMGRAGRTGPGICFRLYSEEEYQQFDRFTPAEIHLVPLDSLILQMITLGLSDLNRFPFLERPRDGSLQESVEKLQMAGALKMDKQGAMELTCLGRSLADLPVDLSIGKMLVMSVVFGNVNAVLAMAALLSVQNPLTQEANRNMQALELRKRMDSSHGDPVCLLNYYQEWLEIKWRRVENSKKWAKRHCLEEQRFYEVTKLIAQFREILTEAKLLERVERSLSSGERAIRYGELKQLKKVRLDLRNEQKQSSNRKVLKLNNHEEEAEDDGKDLRDVEFRISYDFKQMRQLLSETSTRSYRDLMLLKLILTSGLYPQIAVEDEFNASKTVSEYLYHTKMRNFVALKPTSYFSQQPEDLQLSQDEIEVPPAGYFSKRPISAKHQILIYQNLLETKKIYLMNTMRMPAIQTLLLFANEIGSNCTMTKLVFDEFLMCDLPFFGEGKNVVIRAMKLRKKWVKKLEAKLENVEGVVADDGLMDELLDFMQVEVKYNVKRLLAADLKLIYTREDVKFSKSDLNPFDSEFEMEQCPKLGGIRVTDNLVYGCLVQEEWDCRLQCEIESMEFCCLHCERIELGLSVFDRFGHEEKCRMEKGLKSNEGGRREKANETTNKNAKQFTCDKCKKELMLTPIEILKHKKVCS